MPEPAATCYCHAMSFDDMRLQLELPPYLYRSASPTKKARELYEETTLVELSRHLQSAPCDVCEPYDVCNTHYVM